MMFWVGPWMNPIVLTFVKVKNGQCGKRLWRDSLFRIIYFLFLNLTEKIFKMPTEEGNKRREAAMAKYGQVLGEIFDDLDKDKSGFASIEEMWYVFSGWKTAW